MRQGFVYIQCCESGEILEYMGKALYNNRGIFELFNDELERWFDDAGYIAEVVIYNEKQ